MGSLLGKLFATRTVEVEDEVLGCDMVPAPTLLAASFGGRPENDGSLRPASTTFGPFTTSAQAPIRES
jgi:hypothetical protein